VLAQVMESENIPTSQISLIRKHTESIRPPRALWVPFELGRPLGVPGDVEYQTDVLSSALILLEEGTGPILRDYPRDAPREAGEQGWQERAGLPILSKDEISALPLSKLLARELEVIRPLHDIARGKRGRTVVGVSGLKTKSIVTLLNSLLDEKPVDNPHPERSFGHVLKLATEDFKAFYLEAASFHAEASSRDLADWFWDQTAAGEVLRSLRAFLQNHRDQWVRAFAKSMLVPAERVLRTK
jgi:hypothetical protein